MAVCAAAAAAAAAAAPAPNDMGDSGCAGEVGVMPGGGEMRPEGGGGEPPYWLKGPVGGAGVEREEVDWWC